MAINSIPASAIVSVTPSVINAGGSALDLNGLFLTQANQVPVGTPLSFTSATAVAARFGANSTEAAAATVYFAGFDGSTKKPGSVTFAHYPPSAMGAYLMGGSVGTALTLAQLKALTGTLTLTVNGTAATSGTINLSAATSFSNAATIIQAGFTSPAFSVSYDPTLGGFVFTSSTSGASSSITYATGSLAASLYLTAATGALISVGVAAMSAGAIMDQVAQQVTDWATFTTLFDPDDGSGNATKLALAAWNNGRGNRYLYVPEDTDASGTAAYPASASLGYLLQQASYSGTAPIYQPSGLHGAAFVMGAVASIDFTATNGRTTMAFRSQSGLSAGVTDETSANNLISNGYNFYGAYATANDDFTFLYPGLVSGQFAWIDSYVNQIWLNNALQLALMELLINAKSLPYNTAGYAMIKAACLDPINAALTFGAMRTGVSLSSAQAAEVNAAAGLSIDAALSNNGYYLQVLDATAQVRAARGSPPINLWYMDGQSVQQINLASILVQ